MNWLSFKNGRNTDNRSSAVFVSGLSGFMYSWRPGLDNEDCVAAESMAELDETIWGAEIQNLDVRGGKTLDFFSK